MNPIALSMSALALVASIGGGVVAVEDRYATQDDIIVLAANTQQLMVDFRIENARAQLNRLVVKEAAGRATSYDKQAIKQLERELDRLYIVKEKY